MSRWAVRFPMLLGDQEKSGYFEVQADDKHGAIAAARPRCRAIMRKWHEMTGKRVVVRYDLGTAERIDDGRPPPAE